LTLFQQKFTAARSVPEKHIPLLLGCACLIEVFCLLLIAFSPLADLHLSSTPLTTLWPWTLFPFYFLQTIIGPLAQNRVFSSLMLALTLASMTGVYAYAIFALRHLRSNIEHSSALLWLFLGGALLFGVTLLFQPLLFSDDVFTYIFSGRMLAVYGVDPMNTVPQQFSPDIYLEWVISGRFTTNIYGPLWYCFSFALAAISNNPAISLLLFKGSALLAHLLNCVLAWSILGTIAPTRQLQGTLLYAWNPLALIELAGSGHSEGVLLTLLLLAVWLYSRESKHKTLLKIGILPILGLAISINLVTLLLVPLYLWFEVRSQQSVLRALGGFCWRALIVLIPFLGILFPFWRGPETFFAITSAIDMDHFVHAPVSLLALPLRTLYIAVANSAHFPAFLQPITAADLTLRTSASFIFILIYLHLFAQIRHAPTAVNSEQEMRLPGFDVLLTGWTITIFWYLILVSGWFWPWYVLWMFWIVALRRLDVLTMTILILSGTALFIYPFVGFSREPLATYQTALIFGLPLLALLITRIRQGRSRIERTAASYD
jgi:hypothetical protein